MTVQQISKSKKKDANKSAKKRSMSNTTSAHSPQRKPPKQPRNASLCFICLENVDEYEIINCPICLIKVHIDCLYVEEPMRIFELDRCSWLCQDCRIDNCCRCLKDNQQRENFNRCAVCEIGLHKVCYESYDTEPFRRLLADTFLCIPCLTLATTRIPGLEDTDDDDDDFEDDDFEDDDFEDYYFEDEDFEDDGFEDDDYEDKEENEVLGDHWPCSTTTSTERSYTYDK